MPDNIKRHFLREKETEDILHELSRNLHVETQQLLGSKPRIEVAETQSIDVYLLNGKPVLVRLNHTLSPTLFFEEILQLLPRIMVDLGAVPHICNGADLMAPGIVRILGDFNEDDILLIADEKHQKPLAIGKALSDSQHMKRVRHGKVVQNIHYVGDRLWNLLKRIH
ncbi:MAG: DUF1947 domain-containing protein [Candidatus Bathyarchaeota archaeon]|nr:MAG: DUF1947 domain-containing protein [Candidatus Bathyarchaeota archaeon]